MQRPTQHAFAAVVMSLLLMHSARAQDGASEASEVSLQASVEVPVATLQMLAAGGHFSVTALRPFGQSVELVLESAVEGSAVALTLSLDSLAITAVSVGSVIAVSAVTAGFILSVGGEMIAFVPGAAAAALTHHHPLLP